MRRALLDQATPSYRILRRCSIGSRRAQISPVGKSLCKKFRANILQPVQTFVYSRTLFRLTPLHRLRLRREVAGGEGKPPGPRKPAAAAFNRLWTVCGWRRS